MQKPKSLELADIEFWERMDLLIGGARPYPWSERMGLNRSAFQSARTRGKKPLPRTVKVWADKIGCSYDWLNSGIGQPYEIKELITDEKEERYVVKPIYRKSKIFSKPDHCQENQSLENLLAISYEATDGVLSNTYSIMKPTDKTDLIIKFVRGFGQKNQFDDETLYLSIFSIEYPLYQTRQNMSPKDKVQLISDIYKLYDSNAEMKKATLEEYLKYKEDSNSGREHAQ